MIRNQIDRIYEAVRKINQAYEIWAAAHGLTLYEMQIYYVMVKNNDTVITQKALSMELDAPKTSINSIIKKQLQAGYMEMNVNPLNKREKVLSLTEAGQQFAQNLIEPLLSYEEEAAEMLDQKELDAAIEVQNRFADILLGKVEPENE